MNERLSVAPKSSISKCVPKTLARKTMGEFSTFPKRMRFPGTRLIAIHYIELADLLVAHFMAIRPAMFSCKLGGGVL